MQAAIKDRCPAKIDIGPVYNVDPQRRAAYTGSTAQPLLLAAGCLLPPKQAQLCLPRSGFGAERRAAQSGA